MSKIILFVVVCLGVGLGHGVEAALTDKTASSTEVVTTSSSASSTVGSSSPANHDPVAIEKQVRAYFADVPVMVEIAKCESKFRQFTDAGNVLRGGGSGGMVGIFQFYEIVHKAPALVLGFDLDTVEGNLGYARHVYTQAGTNPWASCVPPTIPVVITSANNELLIELLTKVVELLTELLKLELAKGR